MTQYGDQNVERLLTSELAEADNVIGTLGPILRYLLASDGQTMFSDEIIARVRGMLTHVASQLLHALADAAELEERGELIGQYASALAAGFADHAPFLTHAHSLAVEWQLAELMQARHGIDPVLSPLLQALLASSDPQTASVAMSALAAQARYVQSQRRMELSLTELPGDLFHHALLALRAEVGEARDAAAAKAEADLRGKFDESRTRLGLISRLVMGMGSGALAALSVSHAGVAIFLSALALGSGQQRELAILSTSDRQLPRLALALRASGLKTDAVAEQFAYLHPEIALPEGFDQLRSDRAAALLAAASPYPAE